MLLSIILKKSGGIAASSFILFFFEVITAIKLFPKFCLTRRSVMPPDGTGTPSGTWDTDSSAGLRVAVLRSKRAVPSSSQAPHQS